MSYRVLLGSLLTSCILLATCGQAEAFGRRSATCYMPVSCCLPVYCECPPYYPPWPHPIPHHIGWDCVRNRTNLTLRVHITSGYGSLETILHPDECVAFWFYKDGKPRVLSAFTLDNTLVDLTQFSTLDQTGRPHPICYPVLRNAPAPAKGQERQRMPVNDGTHVAPTGQPF